MKAKIKQVLINNLELFDENTGLMGIADDDEKLEKIAGEIEGLLPTHGVRCQYCLFFKNCGQFSGQLFGKCENPNRAMDKDKLQEFKELIITELTRSELEERLIEYYEKYNNLRALAETSDENGALPIPDISGSDERWICQKCGELVDGKNVTFEEYHEGCGGRCV